MHIHLHFYLTAHSHCLDLSIYIAKHTSHKPGVRLLELCIMLTADPNNRVQHTSLVIIKASGGEVTEKNLVATLNERVQALKLLTVLVHHSAHHVPNRHHAPHTQVLHHGNVPNSVICTHEHMNPTLDYIQIQFQHESRSVLSRAKKEAI
jgi:hypothetical protein